MAERRIKVLLVEDNLADARLVQEYLSDEEGATFDMDRVNRLSMAVERLAGGGFDAILLDLSLPDCQGLETFSKMRAIAPDLPIVVETGLDDEQWAIKAVQEGAQDYLVKGHVDSHTLRSAIRHAIERKDMQDRLLSSERMAAAAQMMSGVAHDLDSVLTGIVGYVDLLSQRRDIPPAAQGYVEAVGRQSRKAADLLHRLVDFSRKATGSKHPLSLVHCIQDAIASLQGDLPEGVEVVTDYEESEASDFVVNADQLRMKQVIGNLADNALEAMPEGGELRFALSRLRVLPDGEAPLANMPPGTWVSLEVSDTGVGIERDELPRIFDPFFTTKEVGEGSGLGLAQVYGIVKHHGGYIDVRSRVGEGTTVSVFLPALLKGREELNGGIAGTAPAATPSEGS